jgi:hypothetical protein
MPRASASATGSAATGWSTAAGRAAAAASPTGAKTFADVPTFPLMIRSEFPMIELLELLSSSFEMWTFEIAAPIGESWNWKQHLPNSACDRHRRPSASLHLLVAPMAETKSAETARQPGDVPKRDLMGATRRRHTRLGAQVSHKGLVLGAEPRQLPRTARTGPDSALLTGR